MRELNYYPNEMARSLVNKNSHIIGLIVPYIDHPFFSALTAAIEEASSHAGYKLFLCISGGNQERELEQFAALQANNVAGVLVCTRDSHNMDELLNRRNIPLVSIERSIEACPPWPATTTKAVCWQPRSCWPAAAKRRCFFGNRIVSSRIPAFGRYQGFLETCRQAGCPCNAYYIGAEDLFGKHLEEDILHARELYPHTDGIFATSDVLAAGIQTALWRLAPDYPASLPLVGFDGVSVSEYCRISTVAQPIYQMGEQAVLTLVQLINGEEAPASSILPCGSSAGRARGPVPKRESCLTERWPRKEPGAFLPP